MKVFSSLFFLISLAGSAWAGSFIGGGDGTVLGGAPGPEMSAGLVGMTLAAGVLYLTKRRKRS
jgi:hypothetical protein